MTNQTRCGATSNLGDWSSCIGNLSHETQRREGGREESRKTKRASFVLLVLILFSRHVCKLSKKSPGAPFSVEQILRFLLHPHPVISLLAMNAITCVMIHSSPFPHLCHCFCRRHITDSYGSFPRCKQAVCEALAHSPHIPVRELSWKILVENTDDTDIQIGTYCCRC